MSFFLPKLKHDAHQTRNLKIDPIQISDNRSSLDASKLSHLISPFSLKKKIHTFEVLISPRITKEAYRKRPAPDYVFTNKSLSTSSKIIKGLPSKNPREDRPLPLRESPTEEYYQHYNDKKQKFDQLRNKKMRLTFQKIKEENSAGLLPTVRNGEERLEKNSVRIKNISFSKQQANLKSYMYYLLTDRDKNIESTYMLSRKGIKLPRQYSPLDFSKILDLQTE